MAKSKIVDVNEKIASGVTTGYKKIEDGESVEDANMVITYISYIFSAYSLTIICARSPILFRKLIEAKYSNKYITLYQSDAQLRVKISLYSSVILNILYALLQLFSGFYFHSIWFYALAGYYTLLAIMRFFLLKDAQKIVAGTNKFYEFLLYRFCGTLLLLMNLTLGVIVFYIVWQNRGFEYHYLVSILSLETAMLTAFGEAGNDSFRQIMTAITGAAVCLLVLAMAIYMIIHSTKEINRLKKELSFL